MSLTERQILAEIEEPLHSIVVLSKYLTSYPAFRLDTLKLYTLYNMILKEAGE